MRCTDTRPPFAGLHGKELDALLAALPSPCYLLDEARLRRNGEILLGVQQRTGCKILLAQKAFSNFGCYPVLAPYLAGTEASGLYESRLGREASAPSERFASPAKGGRVSTSRISPPEPGCGSQSGAGRTCPVRPDTGPGRTLPRCGRPWWSTCRSAASARRTWQARRWCS